jgi:hypothetical protein
VCWKLKVLKRCWRSSVEVRFNVNVAIHHRKPDFKKVAGNILHINHTKKFFLWGVGWGEGSTRF